jgi:hypothetical protein
VSQSANPLEQPTIPHVVPVQLGTPLATLHVTPHPPQFFTSSWMAVRHRPDPSQSASPEAHDE